MRCSGLLPGFWRSRQEWRDGLSAGIRGVTERVENCCGTQYCPTALIDCKAASQACIGSVVRLSHVFQLQTRKIQKSHFYDSTQALDISFRTAGHSNIDSPKWLSQFLYMEVTA